MTAQARVPSPAPWLPGQGLHGTSLPVIQAGQWASQGITSPHLTLWAAATAGHLHPSQAHLTPCAGFLGFQVVQLVKNLPANARDTKEEGSFPGSGKIPWSKKWQPTPVFLPEFRSLEATFHGIAKSQTLLRNTYIKM